MLFVCYKNILELDKIIIKIKKIWEILNEIIGLMEEEIVEDFPAGTQLEKCIKQFVVNVGKIVKCPLNQQGRNLFFVVTVSGVREMIPLEDSVEMILEDLILAIKKCTKQFVINVVRNVKSRLNQLATSRFIVAHVLTRETEIKVLVRQVINLR